VELQPPGKCGHRTVEKKKEEKWFTQNKKTFSECHLEKKSGWPFGRRPAVERKGKKSVKGNQTWKDGDGFFEGGGEGSAGFAPWGR